MWCVPEIDQEYIEKMTDVLEEYEKPVDAKKPVICLDEKPVKLREDYRPGIEMKPGRVAARDYEYVRHGTANIFVAVEPKRGKHILKTTQSRKGPDFAEFLSDLSKKYRYASKITLIMDNLNIHCEKSLIKRFGKTKGSRLWKRFDVHYTPKHASWLNQAECEISLISRESIGKSRIPSLEKLRNKVTAWADRANKRRRTIKWEFTKAKMKEKFKLS